MDHDISFEINNLWFIFTAPASLMKTHWEFPGFRVHDTVPDGSCFLVHLDINCWCIGYINAHKDVNTMRREILNFIYYSLCSSPWRYRLIVQQHMRTIIFRDETCTEIHAQHNVAGSFLGPCIAAHWVGHGSKDWYKTINWRVCTVISQARWTQLNRPPSHWLRLYYIIFLPLMLWCIKPVGLPICSIHSSFSYVK